MKFKKLYPLITSTNIKVYSRSGKRLVDGRTEEVTWDKVEEIKNRQVNEIYSYDNGDPIPDEDGDTIIVIVEDELWKAGHKLPAGEEETTGVKTKTRRDRK